MDFEKYKNKLNYPSMPFRPLLSKKLTSKQAKVYGEELAKYEIKQEKFKLLRNEYIAEDRRLKELFEADALEYVGLTGHPKANKAFLLAWERGYSGGYNDIIIHLEELAKLLK
jgi:hypothetical protein